MNNLLEVYINELEKVETIEQYENIIHRLNDIVLQKKFDSEIIKNIRMKAKYFNNKFSDISTMENMKKSKNNLILYLKDILNEEYPISLINTRYCLEKYLKNFYLFLEAFREFVPDKRATLSIENLNAIQIDNEYDLQHLLYAVLKPLCSDLRKEVTEDSGIAAVRSDIKIPSLNSIIEAKCTRKSMTLKKLEEELEADIVHYNAEFIYFYIYDKEKIIKDKNNFETYFNKEFDKKRIYIFVLQPVIM